jgi:hypothetical protein
LTADAALIGEQNATEGTANVLKRGGVQAAYCSVSPSAGEDPPPAKNILLQL